MKRFINKKAVAIVAVVGLALGGAGIASAYILGNGSATGTASVGSGATNGFTVSSPSLQGGPLSINPNNPDTILSSISNFTGLPLTLHQIEVQITGVTVDASIQNPAWPACTVSQFALSALSSSPWQDLTPNGPFETGPTAVWTQNLPKTVVNGDYVTSTQGTSSSAQSGIPFGLTLQWLDQGSSVVQNNCLGATVDVTVSAS
jgi:hypothetical protein